MKTLIISLILLAGLSLASAYTPEQQTTIDGVRLGFQLGVAYQQAQAGQNVAGFNALVDQYNAWVRQHFGEDANLLMSKMNSADIAPWGNATGLQKLIGTEPRKPFNASSDLSKFGRQEILTPVSNGEANQAKAIAEEDAARYILNNF